MAVKLLAPYLASSGAARKRFAREARAAAVVDDPVVPIYNVETEDEHPFRVMKYIAGGSLQQRLDHEGTLEVCEVLRIARPWQWIERGQYWRLAASPPVCGTGRLAPYR